MKQTMVFLLLIFFLSCSDKKNDSNLEKNKIIQVSTQGPKKVLIGDKLESLGNITPFKEASITAEVTGRVMKIYKDTGERVWKGRTILAEIDKEPFVLAVKKAKSAVYQAKTNLYNATVGYKEALLAIEKKFYEIEKIKIQLKEAQLELQENERDFNNKKILFKKGGVSKAAFKKVELQYKKSKANLLLTEKTLATEIIGYRDKDLKDEFGYLPEDKNERIKKIKELRTRTEKAKVDIAKSAYEKTLVELEESELALKKCTIFSNLNGVVGVRKINEGELIKQDSPIFVLFSTDIIYAEFEINEEDLYKVVLRIPVKIKATAYGNREFSGKVALISPVLNEKTRTAVVKVQVRNLDNRLKPGMFVKGTFIPKNKREVLIIPKTSIVKIDSDRAEVFVEQKGYALRKNVIIEKKPVDENFIIKEGLTEEDRIILNPPKGMVEGAKVKVLNH